ncbi:MAG: hypothetical protein NW214_03910 [Pseudanabaenaceae cyanobacterium bins.39]|nr:hypothetical protein [Pseudanabaenaceae cyanobacterium bins.39]
MVYTSLIGFTLVLCLLLGIAFALSYLWWADRYKTPEVIAAEVMLFSERLTKVVGVLAVASLGIGATIFTLIIFDRT